MYIVHENSPYAKCPNLDFTCSLLGPNTFRSAPFPKTPSLHFSLNQRDQFSLSYKKKTGKIIELCFLILCHLEGHKGREEILN